MLTDWLPLALLCPYKFIPSPLLPLLAESPTNTLNEMDSCNVVYKQVSYSMHLCMGWIFGKAGIIVGLPYHTRTLYYLFFPPPPNLNVLKKVILWKQRLHRRTETRVCKFSGPD